MRKTDKKIEWEIIRQLTELCESVKLQMTGFIWLTHEVNYQRFPSSLKVTLVFDEQVAEPLLLEEFAALVPMVQKALAPIIGADLSAKQIEARREHAVH